MSATITADNSFLARLPADRLPDRQSLRALLIQRAALLPQPDRQIASSALSGQHSLRSLARALGLNPGAFSRRFSRILRRLNDPIVAALIDFAHLLPDLHRRVGLARLLAGQSVSAIARAENLPRHQILAILAYLHPWSRLHANPQLPNPEL